MKYVVRDPTSGRLMYRRAYPPQLRPFIPGSPIQLKRTLGTTDLSDPQALELLQAASAEFERAVALAMKVAAGAYDPIDDAMLAYLRAREIQSLQEGAEAARQEGRSEQNLAGWDHLPDEFRAWRVDQDLDEIRRFWGPSAKRLLDAEGLVVSQADFDRVCDVLNEAGIASAEEATRRLQGHFIDLPPDPIRPASPTVAVDRPRDGLTTAPVTPAEDTFEKLAESILDNPREQIGPATKQASRTALRFLREAHGDIRPADITRRSVAEFLDLLSQRPAKLPAAERNLPLREIVAKYEGAEVDRMSVKTLEQHLGSLRALWNKAQGRGEIPEEAPNPFKHKIAARQTTAKPKGLTPEELNAIFRLPVFTRGERPTGGKAEASYWLPLMLLWTGARPEELAQLMVQDVSQDPGSGRWILQITDEEMHPHKGQRVLKTPAARRTFPIPTKLLELNFLDYVTALRSAGETALFPALRPKGERNLLFAGFGEWWGKYLRDHKVPLGGKRPAREFRHTWTTAARVCRVPREARIFIQGHRATDASTNDEYGQLDALGLWIDSLEFHQVDLSAVKPWRPGAAVLDAREAA